MGPPTSGCRLLRHFDRCDAAFDREVEIDAANVAPQLTTGDEPQDVFATSTGRRTGIPPVCHSPPPPPKNKNNAMKSPQAYCSRRSPRWGLTPNSYCLNQKPPIELGLHIGSWHQLAGLSTRSARGPTAFAKTASARTLSVFVCAGLANVRLPPRHRVSRSYFCDAIRMSRTGLFDVPCAEHERYAGTRSVSTTPQLRSRQGPGARNHLTRAPAMAAAAAIRGCSPTSGIIANLVPQFTRTPVWLSPPCSPPECHTDVLVAHRGVMIHVPRRTYSAHCLEASRLIARTGAESPEIGAQPILP